MARLALMLTLFSAIAGARSSRRSTSCGTMACQAGAMEAATALVMKMKPSSTAGVTRSWATSAAKPAVSEVPTISITSSIRRRSKMSASAPAGRPSRNIGSALATCTMATARASGARLVISQPPAAFCIQMPMLETKIVLHITAKARWRNGLSGDAGAGCGMASVATERPRSLRASAAGRRSPVAGSP